MKLSFDHIHLFYFAATSVWVMSLVFALILVCCMWLSCDLPCDSCERVCASHDPPLRQAVLQGGVSGAQDGRERWNAGQDLQGRKNRGQQCSVVVTPPSLHASTAGSLNKLSCPFHTDSSPFHSTPQKSRSYRPDVVPPSLLLPSPSYWSHTHPPGLEDYCNNLFANFIPLLRERSA